MKKMNQQKGFTLVELVVVIVVTGVLAAVATPKFMGISSDARVSSMEGIGATLEAQGQAAFAKSSMENEERSESGAVTLNGGSLVQTFGYATAKETNLNLLIGGLGTDGDYQVSEIAFVAADSNGATAEAKAGKKESAVIFYKGQAAGDNCSVTYAEPTSVGTIPVITVVTSGC